MTIRRLLAELRATPRPLGDIAEACNVSRREVELACEELAATGYPLVAGPRGVWIAASADELRDYEVRLRDRVRSQMRRIHGVQKALRAYEQPLTLGLEDAA